MTEVYDPVTRKNVGSGGPYVKVGLHYEVPAFVPLAPDGPQVGERYTLRDGNRPQISVKCLTQAAPGIAVATFAEV
jgi:hypothetical protein